MNDDELSVGALAQAAGVSTATINYYVREGVLPPPRKINRTRAAYTSRHLRILKLVRRHQASGLPLAVIKKMIAAIGTSDRALEQMESIGYTAPFPAARRDADQTPIEPFDPISRAAFLQRAGVSDAVLRTLEQQGVLRPRAKDQYDARDLFLVRNVKTLLGDGIELAELARLKAMVSALRAITPLLRTSAAHNLDALRHRRLRFRDIMEVYANVERYLFDRILDEESPGWREALIPVPSGDDPAELE